ncbi:HlyD family type I secretion periplasmic adaptor subunit [Ferrimonas senticii]|uniref:HlyD family type I secretion periplasmic adaptor subunit n=1 Tax=Ferrimonas senticii TaxID=394566 RepID=UPI000404CDDB|nr:HlyD family type I secretion periplasmic adaptor subunit [Ferrimonas senticii]
MNDAFAISPSRWVKRAWAVVLIGVVGFGLWAALMPLQAGTVVGATLVVGKDAQVIAHRDGGWIEAIHVEDGQQVQKGQLLMEISDGRSAAELQKWQERVWQFAAERARLQQALDQNKQNLISQLQVPEAIRRQHRQLLAQQLLHQQLSQQELQLKLASRRNEQQALQIKHDSLLARKKLADEELKIARTLQQQAYLAKMQLLQIERANAELTGAIGSAKAQVAAVNADISALQRQLEMGQSQFEARLLARLNEVELALVEAKLSLKNSQHRHSVGMIYAMNDGVIAGLRAQSVATDQIWPGEILMRLVPDKPQLVVEGVLPLTEIDNVWAGLTTKVHLRALDGGHIAPVNGEVVHVDADPTQFGDEQGYRFRVEIPPSQLSGLAQQRLAPGMPVDVFIQLRTSTLLRYLLDPVLIHANRALRES